MSEAQISNDAITEALERARKLASKVNSDGPISTNGVNKRPFEDSCDDPAQKRPNTMSIPTMPGMPMMNPMMTMNGGGGSPPNGGGDQVTEEWAVPDSMVGLIIGRGGEQIQSVQTQSQCRVQMAPDAQGMPNRPCTLTGTREAVDKAKSMIQAIVNKGQQQDAAAAGGVNPMGNGMVNPNGGDMGAGVPTQTVTYEMMCPGNKVGLVIGKGGETLKRIQEQCGVRMMVIQDNTQQQGVDKPLKIWGPQANVDQARQMVEQTISGGNQGGQGGGMGGYARASGGYDGGGSGPKSLGEVIVPRCAVGLIIGKQGETIKKIKNETGCWVQFKMDEDFNANERTAQLTGSPDQIQRATEYISQLVNSAMQKSGMMPQNAFYMHVPANKTGLVIGRGGEHIRQITAESGAQIELSKDAPPNEYEKVFVIKGSPEQIHHAQHLVRIKVGDLPVGTPVPPYQPPAQAAAYSAAAAPQFGGQQPAPGTFSDPNQWASYYQQYYQNPQAAQAQPAQSAAQPSAQPAAPASSAPTINPQTGQPDYSAQWAEYYRQMGMHEQAAAVEAQAKAVQAAAAVAGQSGGAPVSAAQSGQAYPFNAAASQPQSFAYQPQQFAYPQ